MIVFSLPSGNIPFILSNLILYILLCFLIFSISVPQFRAFSMSWLLFFFFLIAIVSGFLKLVISGIKEIYLCPPPTAPAASLLFSTLFSNFKISSSCFLCTFCVSNHTVWSNDFFSSFLIVTSLISVSFLIALAWSLKSVKHQWRGAFPCFISKNCVGLK